MSTYKEKMDFKSVKVTDDFIEIYKNFNVSSQIEKMKKISEKELYLLLVVCLDKYSDDDPVVKHNISNFKKQCLEIFDILDDKKTDNKVLLNLIEETGDSYIETENIIDSKGNPLPKIFTKEEVRNQKIKIINNK